MNRAVVKIKYDNINGIEIMEVFSNGGVGLYRISCISFSITLTLLIMDKKQTIVS